MKNIFNFLSGASKTIIGGPFIMSGGLLCLSVACMPWMIVAGVSGDLVASGKTMLADGFSHSFKKGPMQMCNAVRSAVSRKSSL